jgi:hypothetical protein
MANIINLDNIDYGTIKQDLYDYLKTRDDFADIDTVLASNMDMFLSVFAGYATYMSYKYRQLRQETYLSTAKLNTSVYQIAKTFGLNINRYFAPTINVKYDNIETIQLNTGDIIGSYQDYDIVYLGQPRLIERGDILVAYIGIVKRVNVNTNNDEIVTVLFPEILESIHNECYLDIDGEIIKISRNIEDYLIFSSPIDFSNDTTSTTISISDKQRMFGEYKSIDSTSKVELIYLETDGKIDAISQNDINLNLGMLFESVGTLGTNGDNIDFIKYITPYYYSALRRMVTAKDHKYIIEANEFIKNCYVMRDDGIPSIYNIILDESETEYSVKINDVEYNFNKDNVNSILNDGMFTISQSDNIVTITSINGRVINSFNITPGKNVKVENVQDGKSPLCCSVLVYYIKYDVIDEPKLLNKFEMQQVAEYCNDYKLVGTKLVFIPAQVVHKDINIKVRLKAEKYLDFVREEIKKILSEYELKLDKDFLYGEFIVKVSNITYVDNGSVIKPVDYLTPNQPIFDIVSNGKQYIKFSSVSVNIG